MKHGEKNGGRRYCSVHGVHGVLYPCPEYSQETLDEIETASNKYVNQLRSRSWCADQIENHGVTQDAIAIFRAMAGVETNDWIE